MAKFRLKKKFDVMQVVKNLVKTILSLYVGGTILIQLGLVMVGTESPFYLGLKLIGWTVGGYPLYNATNYAVDCANTTAGTETQTAGACITSTTGSGGILAVVGIIAISQVVLQFVEFSW